MRFSIRFILLLTFVLASFLPGLTYVQKYIAIGNTQFFYKIAQVDVFNAKRQIEERGYSLQQLREELATVDREGDLHLAAMLQDPWGLPLEFVPGSNGVEVFSCGADGISHSQGNDEDDISSWNGVGDYYLRPQRIHKRIAWISGLMGCITLLYWCTNTFSPPFHGLGDHGSQPTGTNT